jgi:hypothetical protein
VPGRVEPEFDTQRIEKGVGHLLPYAHGSIALHVAVPPDREHARPTLADIAL